jgi:hypothetical protein
MSVEGFVTRIGVEATGAVGAIHVSVDNLAFLRKANISPLLHAAGSCLAQPVRVTVAAAHSTLTSCVGDGLRVGEQESRECSNGTQLNSEVLGRIMCLYVYVSKIDAFESLGTAQKNAADLREQQIVG